MLTLLADTFSLGFSATALLFVRLLMTPFLIYNLVWSFKGCLDFLKGRNYPACLYESVIFFMSFGCLGYNALVFAGRTASEWSHPYSLALQCVFFLAVLIATIGKRLSLTSRFEKFYWLLTGTNLDVALRIAEMNQLDESFTHATLDAAEGTLAIRLAQKAMRRESS